MSDGLTEKDAELIAKAMLKAIKEEENTNQNAKDSVVNILEGAGGNILAEKVKKTDLSVWGSIWSSIKDVFVQIWEGVAGSVETLFEIISEWLF